MASPRDVRELGRDDLLAKVGSLQELVVRLQRQLAEAMATIEELRKEVTELRRDSKRQAAPFSKGVRVGSPKRPGRKPGIGSFGY